MKTATQGGVSGAGASAPFSADRKAATTLEYRADIDGLRAIAVGLVLVFHFSLVPAVTGGFLGVDVFFVISGFLISGIVLRQLDAGQFSLSGFYVNRIRRLAPPLFVVLLLVMAMGTWRLFPSELIQLARQVFASQFYFANFYYWRTIGYFGLSAQNVYLLHTWSLGVEEQFYLLYPLALLLVHRYFRRYLWTAIAGCCLLSFVLNVALVNIKPEATFYLLPTRAWQLLLGALASGAAQKWPLRANWDAVLATLGLLLIGGAATGLHPGIAIPGWFALLPAMGSALVLIGGRSSGSWVASALSRTPLIYLGRISYSLYLVHWPVNVFAQHLLADYSVAWRVAMMTLSVVLAMLIYHGVEQPTRHRQLFKTRGILLGGYAVGLLSTACGVLLVLGSHGLPQRLSPAAARMASYADDHSPPLDECLYGGAATLEHPCRIGAPSVVPRWLVYGDSHAWAAHATFDGWLQSRGEAAYFIFLHGCPPLVEVHLMNDRDQCFRFNNDVMSFLERHPDVQRVALVSAWREASEGLLSRSATLPASVVESEQLFADKFAQTLLKLKQLQCDAYVWEPVPGAKRDVPYALARAAADHAAPDLEYSVAEYRATFSFFFEVIKQDHALISGLFSPSEALCDTGKCAVSYQGSPLYFDQAHITQSSAPFWRRVLQSTAMVR